VRSDDEPSSPRTPATCVRCSSLIRADKMHDTELRSAALHAPASAAVLARRTTARIRAGRLRRPSLQAIEDIRIRKTRPS
jgi:hypothetical protein